MQQKWIVNSYNRENSSNPRLRPGTFSNHSMHPKQFQDTHQNKIASTYYVNYRQNTRDKSPGNLSYENPSKSHTHISSENEVYTMILENHGMNPPNDKWHHPPNIAVKPLAEKNSNQIYERDSRNQSNVHTERHSTNDKQNRSSDNLRLKPAARNTANNPAPTASANRCSNSRSPAGYSNRKYGGKPAPATSSKKNIQKVVNDENMDVTNQSKVVRSQSSLTLRQSAENVKTQNSHYQIPVNYGNTGEFYPQEEEGAKERLLRRENQELNVNITKLNAELQHEKKKCAILEAEVENYKDDLVKERDRYKEELFKISQQIKKLRNIQNIYVTEKKHSEKLENQLNVKEKSLDEVSHLLCENLKTMVNILELILLKGDIALDNQVQSHGLNPDVMYKLFFDIRRQVIPRLEESDSYKLDFEWKNCDYKEILSNNKELLKARKNNSRISANHHYQQKDTEIQHAEKKPIVNIPSNYSSLGRNLSGNLSAYSPMFAQPEVIQVQQVSTNWNPKKGNEVTFPHPKVMSINTISEEEHRMSKAASTQPHSQRGQEQVASNPRVNHVQVNIQEGKVTQQDNNQVKSLEELEEGSFSKVRNNSVSKIWEGDSNIADNLMAGSLGSTIVPRTNNCSAFNETFENFLGENTTSRLNNEERKFIGDNNKNYDLPVSMSNLGAQIAKNSNDLESVKNKIMKRKQSIENKRMPSLFYDPSLLLNQPGITENSEESLSSFHKTVEYDSLQKPYDKKAKCNTEEGSGGTARETSFDPKPVRLNTAGYDRAASVEMNKRNSYSPAAKVDSVSARGNETQSRMIRSTSSAAVGMNQAQKNEVIIEQAKKEAKIFSEENTAETQASKHEEQSGHDSASNTTSNEHFAVAKFDYNAQKENDLSFNKGDKIRILRKTETGWWIGLCNNKIGYFPYNFVSVGNQ